MSLHTSFFISSSQFVQAHLSLVSNRQFKIKWAVYSPLWLHTAGIKDNLWEGVWQKCDQTRNTFSTPSHLKKTKPIASANVRMHCSHSNNQVYFSTCNILQVHMTGPLIPSDSYLQNFVFKFCIHYLVLYHYDILSRVSILMIMHEQASCTELQPFTGQWLLTLLLLIVRDKLWLIKQVICT